MTLAVFRTLKYFQQSHQPRIILVQTDNTTILSELDGGDQVPLAHLLARRIAPWCLDRDVAILVVHLAGADNIQADKLSGHPLNHQDNLDKSVEWSLNQ